MKKRAWVGTVVGRRRGVLALLDHRITKTRYGQIFFDSLPEYGFTTRREEVEKFFKHV